MHYACDYDWWEHNHGLPGYKGLRIGGDVRGGRWDVHPVRVDIRRDEILTHRFGVVGSSGNSGFQAVNLAVQFGARVIILLGFDMHDRAGIHWHGKHDAALRNPTRASLARWRGVLDAQAPALEQMGITVLNASAHSALEAYPKMTFADAMRAAGDMVHGAGFTDAREEAFAGGVG